MPNNNVKASTGEQLSSRLGFILIAAGCAIGLGNVWRFPYIVGENGGAIFVLIYLLCLFFMGIPCVMFELSLGRFTRKSIVAAYDVAEPKGSHWHLAKYVLFLGPFILMGFYTVLTGWLFYYLCSFIFGSFNDVSLLNESEITSEITSRFDTFLHAPLKMFAVTVAVIIAAAFICSKSVASGVEKFTKPIMILLLLMLVGLVVYAFTLDGVGEGLRYYLWPNFEKFSEVGIGKVFVCAMNQAFFTLSVGQGSLLVFGSYTNKEHTLVNESFYIAIIDTLVAILAGLVIFPVCFTFGVNPDSGPNLLFVTMMTVFSSMKYGQVIGGVFFFFMFLAAFTTVTSVFEGIIASLKDMCGIKRKLSVFISVAVIFLLAVPVVLGFNVWENIKPLGEGSNILSFLDFIVSTNILPLGALFISLFVSFAWGFDAFRNEVNAGEGVKLPKFLKHYFRFAVPLIIFFIFVVGYFSLFS